MTNTVNWNDIYTQTSKYENNLKEKFILWSLGKQLLWMNGIFLWSKQGLSQVHGPTWSGDGQCQRIRWGHRWTTLVEGD